MSNDRELLELAARAAGIDLEATPTTIWRDGYKDWWNPLTDDGDALRLSVKIGLRIDFTGKRVFVSGTDIDSGPAKQEEYGADPYAATRRAIVRAAATIGKTKEAE